MNNVQKFSVLELLRGWAILGVLIIHTSMYFTSSKQIDLLVLTSIVVDVIAHFAVPLFIFISGFALTLNYPLPINSKKFYIKRIASILPQYLLFSLLYIAIAAAYKSNPVSIVQVIKDILTFKASFHLWFFNPLLGLYLLYPQMRKVYDFFISRSQYVRILLITATIQLLWHVANTVSSSNIIIKVLLFGTTFLSLIFYFTLGMLVCSYKEALLKKIDGKITYFITIVLSNVLLLSAIWVNVYFGTKNSILQVSGSIIELVLFSTIILFLFSSSSRLDRTSCMLKKSLLFIGNYSFGIYLIHIFYMNLFIKFISPILRVDSSSYIFYLTLFLFMLVMSTVSVHIVSKMPMYYLIIGKVNKKVVAVPPPNIRVKSL